MLPTSHQPASYSLPNINSIDNNAARDGEINSCLQRVGNCVMPLNKNLPDKPLYSRTPSDEDLHDAVIDMDAFRYHSAPQVCINDTAGPPIIPEQENGEIRQDSFVAIDMPAGENSSPGFVIHNRRGFLQYLENTGLALSRNLFSVGIPTALREYVNRGLLKKLFEENPLVARTLGGAAIGFPIALQLIGIARDLHNGRQSPASLRARLANISLNGLSGAALVASGGLTLAASALIAAVFVYVPLRDFIQYFLRLGDNNSGELHLKATAKSAALYAFNQVAVDQAMDMLSQALVPVIGDSVAANILGRALINIAGETGDELTWREFNAHQENNPCLQFNLGFRRKDEITCQSALDHLCNTLASRASLFSASFSNAYAVPFGGILNSMVIGATLGAGYVPFIFANAQKNTTRL